MTPQAILLPKCSIVELYFQIVDTACWMVTFGAVVYV